MASVFARAGEDIESLIKRFSAQVEKEGILTELREREYYVSPSEKKHKQNQKQKHLNFLAKLKKEIVV